MKGIISILLLIFVSLTLHSQGKYYTEKGFARFFSVAPLENIEATNDELKAVINLANGELLFVLPVQSFVFEKDLMRRHFNEQYLETNLFPEARFIGKIVDFNPIISFYEVSRVVTVRGELTIHGVTRKITEQATLQYSQTRLLGESKFKVKVKDYDIKIPRLLVRNIAEVVEVTLKVDLEKAEP